MIISDVFVVDVDGGKVRGPLHVSLREATIDAIMEALLPGEGHAQVIKGNHRYLAPGLINVHEHQTYKLVPGPFERTIEDPPESLLLRSVRSALMSLALGVTTIRELGAKAGTNLVMRDAIEAGVLPGPGMQACGECICRTGGHAWQMCTEADGPDEFRRAVRSRLKQGADWIKIMASGGALPGHTFETASAPQLTAEEMHAAVEEARRAGVPTAAHVVGPETMRLCIESGVATIEHGVGLDEATIELLLKHQVWLVPTLSVYHRSVTQAERWQRSGATWAASKVLYERHMATMGRAIEADVCIAAGTDSIGDMVEEMYLLVDLGMETAEAVRCATINGARLMGIDDLVGTVEPGKRADLVLLEENPLLEPGAYGAPALVIQSGRVVYDQEGGLKVEVHS